MTHFLEYFLGNHDISFHIAGVIFALIGILIAKYYYWKKHKAICKVECKHESHSTFNIKKWVNENIFEVLVSVLVSFVVVRFIDTLLHWEWLQTKAEAIFGSRIPLTEDQVFYYFAVGFLIQIWMHKKFRK